MIEQALNQPTPKTLTGETFQDLLDRNYIAVCERGLIKQNTKDSEFYKACKSELVEAFQEIIKPPNFKNKELLDAEIMDVTTVCLNWLKHRNCNVFELLKSNVLKNESRAREAKESNRVE